jgi:Iap family predicted aminopeptidase
MTHNLKVEVQFRKKSSQFFLNCGHVTSVISDLHVLLNNNSRNPARAIHVGVRKLSLCQGQVNDQIYSEQLQINGNTARVSMCE